MTRGRREALAGAVLWLWAAAPGSPAAGASCGGAQYPLCARDAGRDEELGQALAALSRDPADASARSRVEDLIREDRELYAQDAAPALAPATAAEREAVVADARRALMAGGSRDASLDDFSQGLRDYGRGRLLSAWRRLSRFLESGRGPAWAVEEAQSLLSRRIPAALKAKLAGKPPALREPYGAGWRALRRGRVEEALRFWKDYAERIRDLPYPQRELADLEEVREADANLQGVREAR